jgi:hypothetical protein
MGAALLLTGGGFIVLASGLIGRAGIRRRRPGSRRRPSIHAPSSSPSSSA